MYLGTTAVCVVCAVGDLTGRFVLGAELSLAVRIDEPAHSIVRIAVASRCQAALPYQIERRMRYVAARAENTS